MPPNDSLRRAFLKRAGAGFAGSALALNAQTEPEMKASLPGRGPTFGVRNFGAAGDGRTLDTAAINKAIEAAAAAGGGTVFLPAGNYLCHSIHLRSNVALHLDSGATIVAADANAGAGYDLAEPNPWDQYQDFGHSHWHNSLIWGEGLENVAIGGAGRIWGKGLSRGWSEGPRAEDPGVGNKAISLKNCHNVVLRDFSILHGGHFGVLATGVDNLTIDSLWIDTNRDGIDVDCCHNVRISNCSVNSPWYDGICLKSSFGLGWARPTESVTIANCCVSGCFEEGTMLEGTYKRFAADARVPQHGRIKFGTESNGGFRNITVSNCVFEGCQGLALESVDGAQLEDVTITNIAMRDIASAPIFLRLGARMRGPAGAPVGTLKRVIISNVVCANAASAFGSIISGIPGHAIEDVRFSNIYIQHRGGGTREQAGTQPEEKEGAYPEPDMFGPMPSWGFYVRHARGIQLDNVELSVETEDQRPAFVLTDVEDAGFSRVRTPRSAASTFALREVSDLEIRMCRPAPDTHLQHAERASI